MKSRNTESIIDMYFLNANSNLSNSPLRESRTARATRNTRCITISTYLSVLSLLKTAYKTMTISMQASFRRYSRAMAFRVFRAFPSLNLRVFRFTAISTNSIAIPSPVMAWLVSPTLNTSETEAYQKASR